VHYHTNLPLKLKERRSASAADAFDCTIHDHAMPGGDERAMLRRRRSLMNKWTTVLTVRRSTMKRKLIIAALLVSIATPSSAASSNFLGFRIHGLWAGLAGCQNDIPENNRYFSNLLC
jgi:hypothetical protein